MGRIPTVKIHDPNKLGDFRIINESELDLSVHRPVDPEARFELSRTRKAKELHAKNSAADDELLCRLGEQAFMTAWGPSLGPDRTLAAIARRSAKAEDTPDAQQQDKPADARLDALTGPEGRATEAVAAVTAGQGVEAQAEHPAYAPQLCLHRDEYGQWFFTLGNESLKVKKDYKGFRYMQVLCDKPWHQYSPSDLRDLVDGSDRETTKPQTDRKSVVRAYATARSRLPPNVQTHAFQHIHMGQICCYEPPRLSPE
jgi:hypothetical protein